MKVGGLGLGRLVPQNISVVTNLDSLSVRILRKFGNVLGNNTCWSIGDGQTANFLYDCWIPEVGPLSNHVLDGSVLPAHLKVADLVDSDGCWNWTVLQTYFTSEVLEYIAMCPPPPVELRVDGCQWKSNGTGKFSVKTAYNSLVPMDGVTVNEDWRVVWDNDLPPRIKHFMWLVMHRKCQTNEERARRNLTNDAGCALCEATQETILHASRDCHGSVAVWSQQCSSTLEEIIRRSKSSIGRIRDAATNKDRLRARLAVRIKWCPPNSGWVKINIDGASNSDGNRSTTAGVIRDSYGNWVAGFKPTTLRYL
ncbi:hypothetical protein J1N35_023230 [Gossypium stocksii]|uniref:Reverse transcriptase zinc-binding domain-containing protein n=1 Tax=Gossypium stocksii TaxID=47602 RepID=A0A9D4A491_9ROSI|nr:hypothetical protein J1N35_023230 [Gossypium stocksii]